MPPSLLGAARIGLGAAYGLPASGVRRAFERGVRFFLWGALPKADFGAGLRGLSARHRDTLRIAVQTYARRAFLIRPGVELALWRLGLDALDFLCLANWEGPPPDDVIDAGRRLIERGLVRHLMISSHHRPTFAALAGRSPPPFAAWMLRYNAAHRRAEEEVFALRHAAERPAHIAYTALRWGTLLDPRYAPPGEPPLSAVEAYRFVLSNPAVDLCLAGPRNEVELDAALDAMAQGPLSAAGLLRARRIGDAAYAFGRAQPPPRLADVIKEAPSLLRSLLREGVTENLLSRFNR
jgi:hypothetical protein